MSPRRRIRTLVAVVPLSLTIIVAGSSPALAEPEGDGLVISEYYGGGGNSGARLTHDFIELFNPTDAPISLDGRSLSYISARSTTPGNGNTVTLSGEVPAQGHFLITAAHGNGGTEDITGDLTAPNIAMSATAGVVTLQEGTAPYNQSSSDVIDMVGVGNTQLFEGQPARATSNTASASRDAQGTDTDNNFADFTIGEPTPMSSTSTGGVGEEPNTPEVPEEPTEPGAGESVSIEEIQGTGDISPMVDKTVTTSGRITATYPDGGLNGFFIQASGNGELREKGADSQGLFVYSGPHSTPDPAAIGDCVSITGKVSEYYGQTQVSGAFTPSDDCGDAVQPITAPVPVDEEQREANEGMLFQPDTGYTVTDNYQLSTYGSIGIVEGNEPLKQATSVVAPGPEAVA